MRTYEEHLWLVEVLKELKKYAIKQNLGSCADEIAYSYRQVCMALCHPQLMQVDPTAKIEPAESERDRALELLETNGRATLKGFLQQ